MNKEVRGFVAIVGTLILLAIGAVALGNPLLGPGMVLGYLGRMLRLAKQPTVRG